MSALSVFYGVPGAYVDVTNQCMRKSIQGMVSIPKHDGERCEMFYRDPAPSTVKHVLIVDVNAGKCLRLLVNFQAFFPTAAQSLDDVTVIDINGDRKIWWHTLSVPMEERGLEVLKELHARLTLSHGSFLAELPEQLMAIKHIKPGDTVLELGTNIGRNSLVISTILNDDRRLVTLESNPQHVREAISNRDANKCHFHIEGSALSARPLVQIGWYSELGLGDAASDGTKFKVNTITWSELQEKYRLKFNVLVADCEGALYNILQDEPTFFTGFDTVILENDFVTQDAVGVSAATQKDAIDAALTAAGLRVVYQEAGPPDQPLYIQERFVATWSRFYEVWKRE